MTAREVIKLIEADGWRLTAVKGSHHQFIHLAKKGKITVALHKGDIPPPEPSTIL